MSTTQYLNSDWIIYLGNDTYYYAKSGSSGKVLYSGLTYNTVKNSVTGSLTGTVFDDTLNRYEGYTSGILQSYIDFDTATYSGSTITATNAYVTNLTGSGTISGSTVAASTLSVASFNPANIVATTITGSTRISGSTVNATTFSGSNITAIGTISGSVIWASNLRMKGYKDGGTPLTGSAINLKQGTNVTIISDNDSDYLGYTISSNTGSGELPASYVIWSGSGTYFAQSGHSGTIISNANAANLINNVLTGSLTANRMTPEKVVLKGVFALTTSIKMPSYTILEGPCLLVANGLSTHFITLNDVTDATEIFVKFIDISGSAQSSGKGINFSSQELVDPNGDEWNTVRTFVIEDCKIRSTAGQGIYISSSTANSGPVYVKGCNTHLCGGPGIALYNITDSEIYNNHTAGLYCYHITSSLLKGNYCGNLGGANAVDFIYCQRVRISDMKLDSFSRHGINIDDACRSLMLSNIEIKVGSQLSADNTYDGIHIADADYSTFQGVTVHQTSGTNHLAYSINEVSPSDYNTFSNMVLELWSPGNVPLNKVGTHSVINCDGMVASGSYAFAGKGYASVANGGTIAHGLIKIPLNVQLMASGSNPLQFSYTADDTNITVYHTSGDIVGVFWRAEV